MIRPHSLPAGKWQHQNGHPELSFPLGFWGLINVVGKVGRERGAPSLHPFPLTAGDYSPCHPLLLVMSWALLIWGAQHICLFHLGYGPQSSKLWSSLMCVDRTWHFYNPGEQRGFRHQYLPSGTLYLVRARGQAQLRGFHIPLCLPPPWWTLAPQRQGLCVWFTADPLHIVGAQ